MKRKHILGRPIIYDICLWGMCYIPRRLAYAAGSVVAYLSYLFCKKARENVITNLRRALPNESPAAIPSIALKTFRNYSRYLVDYGRFRKLTRESLFNEIVRVDGGENIEDALGRGKGMILLTAHLGNWELGGIFFGRQDIKINVLTLRDGVDSVDMIRERYRRFHNINTIVIGDTPFAGLEILNALRNNEIVAMLVDRPGEDGISVPFFGRPTLFPEGPMILARATGAAIMPAFVVSEEGGYRVIAERPIYFDDDAGDTPESVAGSIVEVFENYIRKYPDQWYNFVPI